MNRYSIRARTFYSDRDGIRLDRLLADTLGCGRRQARELIQSGLVHVSGRRPTAATLVDRNDLITVQVRSATIPRPDRNLVVPVLWEDASYLALAKPAGLHTLPGRTRDSVAEFLERERPAQRAVSPSAGEAGILHRLDRDTSGVLLVAKTRQAYLRGRDAFVQHKTDKQYLALVAGRFTESRRIEVPLARLSTRVRVARTGERSYPALTEAFPLEAVNNSTLVGVRMSTGVTHQIRAHLAFAGHPVLGDLKYGEYQAPPGSRSGQLLHAFRISIPSGPDVTAPVPADFLRALWLMRRES